jgi:hypothetical protein
MLADQDIRVDLRVWRNPSAPHPASPRRGKELA